MELKSTNTLDIVNSKSWNENDWFTFVTSRLNDMRSKRSDQEKEWTLCDTLTESVSFYDNRGVQQIQLPIEKTLKEIYMGRTNGKATFDIVPDGQANVDELQPTKFAMTFFLDGNGKDTFWKENKSMRENKCHYGNGIFFTGMRSYEDLRFTLKKGVKIQLGTDLLDENNFDKKKNETWFFFPQSVHPRDFYPDDHAYGSPDVQKAMDCIRKEKIGATEFNMRYANNPAFTNIDQLTYGLDQMNKNKNDEGVQSDQYIIYHYYHRITKKYIIMVNETYIIYNGIYLYNDGKLPFENIQHYSDNNSFWAQGIPGRVRYLKIAKSEIFQDIMEGAAMNNSVNLVVGNDDEIGQDWEVGNRGVNLWRIAGGADKVQQVSTGINLGFFTSILELLDRQEVKDSGIDSLAQVQSTAPTLGQEELVEANKAVRNSSVDENYNIGLDGALTMMLDRIKTFAPALLMTTIEDSDGGELKDIFPTIRIDGYEVKKENGKQVFVENIGKYGYFELKGDNLPRGVGVKITTASTNTILPILERQKVNEFTQNFTNLANIAMLDQTGEQLKELFAQYKISEVMGWMNDAYGYDSNSLKANSEKDNIKKKNLEKIKKLQEVLTIDQTQNAQPMGTPNAQPETPTAPVGQSQPTATNPNIGGGIGL